MPKTIIYATEELEKRIKELERSLECATHRIIKYRTDAEDRAKRIAGLEAENAALREALEDIQESIEIGTDAEIRGLAQKVAEKYGIDQPKEEGK